jgi:hypothetical protein
MIISWMCTVYFEQVHFLYYILLISSLFKQHMMDFGMLYIYNTCIYIHVLYIIYIFFILPNLCPFRFRLAMLQPTENC